MFPKGNHARRGVPRLASLGEVTAAPLSARRARHAGSSSADRRRAVRRAGPTHRGAPPRRRRRCGTAFPAVPPLAFLPLAAPLAFALLVLEPLDAAAVDPREEVRPAFGFPTDAVRSVPQRGVLRQDRERRVHVVRREFETRREERLQGDDLGRRRQLEEEPRQALVQGRGEPGRWAWWGRMHGQLFCPGLTSRSQHARSHTRARARALTRGRLTPRC